MTEEKKKVALRVSGDATITVTDLDGSSRVFRKGEYSAEVLEALTDGLLGGNPSKEEEE